MGPTDGQSIRPDFPSLADEIAEPRPDMNIKIASFTVSEKSINIKEQQKLRRVFVYAQCHQRLHCTGFKLIIPVTPILQFTILQIIKLCRVKN